MSNIPFRIGFGYDVHQYTEGRPFMLGGVEIPFEKGLKGHSDADVLLHVICDALLGALNLRDIGYNFPDTDPTYKNIDSKILLKETVALVHGKNYQIGNIDCTVCAELPKLNPHIPTMTKIIAEILKIEEDQVSIKATTTEKLGFVGRLEGVEAHCVALVYTQE